MKYFSAEWARLDSEEANRISLAYDLRIALLPGHVGSKIREFVRSMSLADALLDYMSISTKSKIVVLRVIAGDNQSGYFAHEITYSEASVAGLSVNELASVLDLRSSVLRFDEFDFNERPRNQSFVHRMLLWPEHRGELEIAFQDLNIRSLPLSIRGYINFGISFDLRD